MFERQAIANMAGYTPGLQPGPDSVKLNTNENPLPPSARVMQALHDITPEMLRRYPDPRADPLRTILARHHGLGIDQIVTTNGSDELLRLAITTFAAPGQAIGVLAPGYPLYDILAQIQGCPLAAVDLQDDWSPPRDLAERWVDSGAVMAIIANPQAPSGRLIPADAVEDLAHRFNGLLVVDEAYVDFVDPGLGHDLTARLDGLPNVLLSRSLSKGHSLAGLRLGYGMGHREVIGPMLSKTRDSYNVDVIAQHLACAAMSDPSHARSSWALVREERLATASALTELGLEPLASEANFLLVRVPAGLCAESLFHALAEVSVHVRWFNTPRLADHLRISIGSPMENPILLETLRPILR